MAAPLVGKKVIEFAGLAPAPYCGLILSDFGANVIRIDKVREVVSLDRLCRGKRSVAIDLKRQEGIQVVKRLCSNADVLIEPFRPGVMERLGLGPKVLLAQNPQLVYARLTGFGQSGSFSSRAGHDINYLALSGILSTLGQAELNPYPPINLLGDFAGGGLICALGIVLALLERTKSGLGQVVDANIVEGTAYVSTFRWSSRSLSFLWNDDRGKNVLDGGKHFYATYKTKDGKYIAVGALEPQFYAKLLEGLQLSADQLDESNAKATFANLFATKTQAEWCSVFDKIDGCVTPVLSLDEAADHPHNKARGSFLQGQDGVEPRPAPILERTPAQPSMRVPIIGQQTKEVLAENGFSDIETRELLAEGIVEQAELCKSKL